MSDTDTRILDDIKRASEVTRDRVISIEKKLDEILAVLKQIATALENK